MIMGAIINNDHSGEEDIDSNDDDNGYDIAGRGGKNLIMAAIFIVVISDDVVPGVVIY